jgi:hypothetical protein
LITCRPLWPTGILEYDWRNTTSQARDLSRFPSNANFLVRERLMDNVTAGYAVWTNWRQLTGYSVLFTTAVDIINTLTAAQTVSRLKTELKHYLNQPFWPWTN